ncbi:MAG TPA: hypothetical protein GXX28_11555 [Firmicutes bacterium]|nr:hypothetical protein [Bacillota bacterium]
MRGLRFWQWTVGWLLVVALALGIAGVAVAADPDPVAELRTYLEGLDVEPNRVGLAVEAVRESLAAGADPAAVLEMVRTMAREKADPETALRICERVRTMAQNRLNLGEVVRELHLALGKGAGLEAAVGEAEERAMAQNKYQYQNQNQHQYQYQTQSQAEPEAGATGDCTQDQTRDRERDRDQDHDQTGGGQSSGGSGGKGSGK